MEHFLTLDEVSQRTTLSRSTLKRKIAAGEFPRPVNLSDAENSRRIAWPESDVSAWIQERIYRSRGSAPTQSGGQP